MINCIPMGICSWNYRLSGLGQNATMTFNWFTEEGDINVNGVGFQISKGGMFSGHWTLNSGGQTIASAQKGFTRHFDVKDSTGQATLKARSPFGRSFDVYNGSLVATIKPHHALTRRATIRVLDPKQNFATLTFMFWLVALTWRRRQKNND